MDFEEVLDAIKMGLESVDHDTEKLTYIGPVSGGIVNQAALYDTGAKKYFVKWNTKPCVSIYAQTRTHWLYKHSYTFQTCHEKSCLYDF